ncbi:chromosome condensation protein CrcB [Paenibacillus sp. J31TS4]|uniref:fluoride efflux transporter FluC n=1 Tax=Paenibacillus sp. J31TS4 TaxID=2807195 RepID=UPI001B1EDEB0|nr:CrcB family protein [Paenibacillus sp. J31TS4]GIP40886.1 chromosome condensation protein CrcB [Paenibacillus sp. J31TS4]
MTGWLLVAAGGFAGALARYGVSLFSARRWGSRFPIGTLTVNASGAFLLGWLSGSGHTIGGPGLLLGTGFLGAYTTFSTLNTDAVKLAAAGRRAAWPLYLGIMYSAGLLLAYAGYAWGSR